MLIHGLTFALLALTQSPAAPEPLVPPAPLVQPTPAPAPEPLAPPAPLVQPTPAPVAAPAPAPEGPIAPPAPAPAPRLDLVDAPHRPGGPVFSLALGVNYLPIFPIPSGDLSLFVGGALPTARRRPGQWLALGYRGTLSVGLADILISDWSLFGHRHHFALQGAAGRRGRFYYAASAGLAVFTGIPDAAADQRRRSDIALEGEGRIGAILGDGDVRFIAGLQLRMSARIRSEFDGHTPMIPTIGLFLGFNFGRGLHPAPRCPAG